MSKPDPIDITVERHIEASPQTLYSLVSDVTRMPEWSPELTEAKWLDGATEAAVGARFQGFNRLGTAKWSTKPMITKAEPGVVFEFKVPKKFGPLWRYEFHPTATGTRVVESVIQARTSPPIIRYFQRKNGVQDRANNLTTAMAVTLKRLAESATS